MSSAGCIMNWLTTTFFAPASVRRARQKRLRAHIEEKIEELVAGGMPLKEAAAAARREFGNVESVRETAREAVGLEVAGGFDGRCAIRPARAAPQSGIYSGGVVDDRDWNRRKRGGLQCCE